MKRIGIVTFHKTHNFGASLQCYALKETIKDLGYNVEILNHSNKKIDEPYKLYSSYIWNRSFIGIVKSLIHHSLINTRKLFKYLRFRSFLNCVSSMNDDSGAGLDTIVFGSDQIWNLTLTGHDKYYFGVGLSDKAKKISYAGSAGKINKDFNEAIELFDNFDAISCRETSLTEILLNNNIIAQTVIDPSLLLNAEKWISRLNIKRRKGKRYILVFAMQKLDICYRYAQLISDSSRIKYDIRIIYPYVDLSNIFKRHVSDGPKEFVELMYNADIIVTDSFHGTAFAINLNKEFYTIKQGIGFDGRAESLLTQLNITERLVSPTSYPNLNAIDYFEVNSKLNQLREDSINWLRFNL